MTFPLCQRYFVVLKAVKNMPTFSVSVTLLNKRSIKLYTTSSDAPWWSVATSFQSTLIFNTLSKYIQTNSIHHMELIYVERQADRTA